MEKQNEIDALDLLAASAPKNIPDWFKPVMSHAEPEKPSISRKDYSYPDRAIIIEPNNGNEWVPTKTEIDVQAYLASWLCDPCYDLDDQFRAFQEALETYWNAKCVWDADCEIERSLQWPYAYAKAVLSRKNINHGEVING